MMGDKKKGKKRKEELLVEEAIKPSKEEYSIAQWLRKNVPTKKTKFLNHNVEYFTGTKAVDALLDSHWGKAKQGEEAFFPSRHDVVEFLDKMLRHKFFHRARKVPVSEQELKAKLRRKEKDKKSKDGDEKSEKSEKLDDAESSHAEGDRSSSQDQKEKKKRKIRLEMHLDQLFVDGLDAYVWIYDPIPVYYWFIGTLVVLGVTAICLFPLWPPVVRKGVYFISITAAGFLMFIVVLTFARILIFCLLWALTLGKHHLWLFPNLTEDVGFFASFWPLYQYEYRGESNPSKKSKKKKKEKYSDNEDDTGKEETKTESTETSPTDYDRVENVEDQSESESESSQKSQTGRDFEMVEKEEIES